MTVKYLNGHCCVYTNIIWKTFCRFFFSRSLDTLSSHCSRRGSIFNAMVNGPPIHIQRGPLTPFTTSHSPRYKKPSSETIRPRCTTLTQCNSPQAGNKVNPTHVNHTRGLTEKEQMFELNIHALLLSTQSLEWT